MFPQIEYEVQGLINLVGDIVAGRPQPQSKSWWKERLDELMRLKRCLDPKYFDSELYKLETLKSHSPTILVRRVDDESTYEASGDPNV